jgi:acetoin utilization protein AcuA
MADLTTRKGVVHIRTYCSPDFVDGLELDEGLGVFPQYRSIIRDKETLKKIAVMEDANLVIAYNEDGKIVGYVAFCYPSPLERWGKNGHGLLYEVGSIEVSRDWRRLGLAKNMVEIAMEDEEYEDKILFLTGFSWHWDMQGTGLTKPNYRKMLVHIFEPFGFRHFYTTEPNVTMDSASMLMARIGARVSDDDRERFLDLLFAEAHAWEPC